MVLGLAGECPGLGDGVRFWGRGVHAVVVMLVFRGLGAWAHLLCLCQ